MLRKLFAKFRQKSEFQIIPVDKNLDHYESEQAIIRPSSRSPPCSSNNSGVLSLVFPSRVSSDNNSATFKQENCLDDLEKIDKEKLRSCKAEVIQDVVRFLNNLKICIRESEGIFPAKVMLQLSFVEYKMYTDKITEDYRRAINISPLLTVLHTLCSSTSSNLDLSEMDNSETFVLSVITDIINILQSTTLFTEHNLTVEGSLTAIDLVLTWLSMLVEQQLIVMGTMRVILTAVIRLLSVYQDDILNCIGRSSSPISHCIILQVVCSASQLVYTLSVHSRRAYQQHIYHHLSSDSYIAEVFAILQRLSTILVFSKKYNTSLSHTPCMYFWQACEAVYDNVVLSQFQDRRSGVWNPSDKRVAVSILSTITTNCIEANSATPEELYQAIMAVLHSRDICTNHNSGTYLLSWKKLNITMLGVRYISRIFAKEVDVSDGASDSQPYSGHSGPFSARGRATDIGPLHNNIMRVLLESLICSLQPSQWEIEGTESAMKAQVLVNNLLMIYVGDNIDVDMSVLDQFDSIAQILQSFVTSWSQSKRQDSLASSMKSYASSSDGLKRLGSCENSFDEGSFGNEAPQSLGSLNISGSELCCTSPTVLMMPSLSARTPKTKPVNSVGMTLHSVTSRDSLFVVGDIVDGLCTLKNGTKRWFPGQISAVNMVMMDGKPTTVYSVLYNDGEEQINKNGDEIRSTKSRIGSKDSEKMQESARSARTAINALGSVSTVNGPNGRISCPSPSLHKYSAQIAARSPSFRASISNPISSLPDLSKMKMSTTVLRSNTDSEVLVGDVKSPRSVTMSDDDADADAASDYSDNIFEIPSVFGEKNLATSQSVPEIPRIELSDMALAPSTPLPSLGSFSLSGALLKESPNVGKVNGPQISQRCDASTGRSIFHSGRSNMTNKLTNRYSGVHSAKRGIVEVESDLMAEPVSSRKDVDLSPWIPVFVSVSSLLLRRCIIRGKVLDVSSCFAKIRESSDPMDEQQTTTVFAIRSFLSCEPGLSYVPHIASFANQCDFSCTRLLKLLTPSYFNSCLVSHDDDSERIASGGFGTVHRYVCPATCNNCCRTQKQSHSYAVKKIPREWSGTERPIILDIYNEVSCLEKLSGNRGVCKLHDYGVCGGEYWLVLEEGKRDLLDWRLEQSSSDSSSVMQLGLYILMYQEIIRIVQHVHAAGIVHYDIKCSNFILRGEPNIELLLNSQLAGRTSGLIFITDFGEAAMVSDSPKDTLFTNRVLAHRSRGTLPIQSPEMLRLSDTNKTQRKSSSRRRLSRDTRDSHSQLFSSDIWSVGCLLVELITGKFLFEGKAWAELYVLLCLEKSVTLPLDEFLESMLCAGSAITDAITDMLLTALRTDPLQRCSLFHISLALEKIRQLFLDLPRDADRNILVNRPIVASVCPHQQPEVIKADNSPIDVSERTSLSEIVSVPCGLWDLGAGVLFESTTESLLECRENTVPASHISDLLFVRIDEAQSLERNHKLDSIVRSIFEHKMEELRKKNSSILNSDSSDATDVFYVLRLNSQNNQSIESICKLYHEAVTRLDRGVIVVISIESVIEATPDSMSSDRANGDCCSCSRKLLSTAIALAYSLANRDETSHCSSTDDALQWLEKVMPWFCRKCNKDLLVLLNNKIEE